MYSGVFLNLYLKISHFFIHKMFGTQAEIRYEQVLRTSTRVCFLCHNAVLRLTDKQFRYVMQTDHFTTRVPSLIHNQNDMREYNVWKLCAFEGRNFSGTEKQMIKFFHKATF